MTFEEAKERSDYKFRGDYAAHYLPDLIKSMTQSDYENYFSEEYGDGGAQFGIAMLEIGYIDIELNLTEYGVEYFICTKGKDGDWESVGYVTDMAAANDIETASLDWLCGVDFGSAEWKDELEQDMFRVLNEVVEKMGYKYDEANESEVTY